MYTFLNFQIYFNFSTYEENALNYLHVIVLVLLQQEVVANKILLSSVILSRQEVFIGSAQKISFYQNKKAPAINICQLDIAN
jgi:hypothetical protein